MDNPIIKRICEKHLQKKLLSEIDSIRLDRELRIQNYIESELSKFNNTIKTIVYKNNHPYIRFYLEAAVEGLLKDIKERNGMSVGATELFL